MARIVYLKTNKTLKWLVAEITSKFFLLRCFRLSLISLIQPRIETNRLRMNFKAIKIESGLIWLIDSLLLLLGRSFDRFMKMFQLGRSLQRLGSLNSQGLSIFINERTTSESQSIKLAIHSKWTLNWLLFIQ